MATKRGFFIVFEGLAGSGKTTQSKLLVKQFEGMGQPVLWNCEPTKGFFGSLVRKLINQESFELDTSGIVEIYHALPYLREIRGDIGLDLIFNKIRRGEPLQDLDRQTLFICDRLHDIVGTIKPNLEQGTSVVQDRYDVSTFAHGIAHGISFQKLFDLQRLVLRNRYASPDAILFLDVSPEEAFLRRTQAGDISIYDTAEKMKAIDGAYRTVLALDSSIPFVEGPQVIPGEGTALEVREYIFERLQKINVWS